MHTLSDFTSITETEINSHNIVDSDLLDIINNAIKYFFTQSNFSLYKLNSVIDNSSITSTAMGFTGNAIQMKVISEALSLYLKHENIDFQYLSDAAFGIEVDYQNLSNLKEDDCGFSPQHAKALGVNNPEEQMDVKINFTTDAFFKTNDGFLRAFISNSLKSYKKDAGLSDDNLEQLNDNFISFDNNFVNAAGSSFQMKVLSEAISLYLSENNISNNSLEKMSTAINIDYKKIHNLPNYYYSPQHLHAINKDYKSFIAPIKWLEAIEINLNDVAINRIIGEDMNIDNITFRIPTANYTEMEMSDLTPKLALRAAVVNANEQSFKYIGNSELSHMLDNKDYATGRIQLCDENVIINSHESPFDKETSSFKKLKAHPNFQNLVDRATDLALSARDENVTNGDIGTAYEDIYYEDELEDFDATINEQVLQYRPFIHIENLSYDEIASIYDISIDNPDTGYSGVIELVPGTIDTYSLSANNTLELIALKDEAEFYKIAQINYNDLSLLYSSIDLPMWLYEKYVSATGLDPLEKHPDLVENFHFPTNPTKPNANPKKSSTKKATKMNL